GKLDRYPGTQLGSAALAVHEELSDLYLPLFRRTQPDRRPADPGPELRPERLLRRALRRRRARALAICPPLGLPPSDELGRGRPVAEHRRPGDLRLDERDHEPRPRRADGSEGPGLDPV